MFPHEITYTLSPSLSRKITMKRMTPVLVSCIIFLIPLIMAVVNNAVLDSVLGPIIYGGLAIVSLYFVWYSYATIAAIIRSYRSTPKVTTIRFEDDTVHGNYDEVASSFKWDKIKSVIEYKQFIFFAVTKKGKGIFSCIPMDVLPPGLLKTIENKVIENGGRIIEKSS